MRLICRAQARLQTKERSPQPRRAQTIQVCPPRRAAHLQANPSPIPNRGRERRIRRGQAAIAATLDLHGYTMDAAQHQLESFLASHLSRGARCVLVITGKGRAGEGVLRRQLLNWLGTSQAKHLVSGYAQAHRKHGGSGAWYIFLRKPDA